MKMRPEIAKSILAQKVVNGALVCQKTVSLLGDIKGKLVIELGGIGAVAEYLSANNDVKLCEETRLYFVYRRHLLPNSTVVEINMDPRLLNYSKPYYDVVIISGPQYLDIARRLSSSIIFDTESLTIEKIESAPDNITVNEPVTKDVVAQEGIEQQKNKQSDSDLLDRDVQEGP